jgi:hypothetical protein
MEAQMILLLQDMKVDRDARTAERATDRAAAALGKVKTPKLTSLDADAWRSFKTVFNQVAQSNGWMAIVGERNAAVISAEADKRGRLALSTCFQGSTATHLARYNPGKYSSLDLMLQAIETHLIPASATSHAQQLYDDSAQKEGEDLLKWHGRLLLIYSRAFPNTDAEQCSRIKRKYVTGLRSSALLGALLASESFSTWTYTTVLANSQQKGSALDCQDMKSSAIQGSHLLGTVIAMTINTEPTDRVAALETQFKSFAINQNCWNCFQPGHMKYQCPQPKREFSAPAGRGRGGSGKGGHPGHHRSGGGGRGGRNSPANNPKGHNSVSAINDADDHVPVEGN